MFNDALMVDHSQFAILIAIMALLFTVSALFKPSRALLLLVSSIVVIHLPPFHAQYETLGLNLGEIKLHVTDQVFLASVVVGIKSRLTSFRRISGIYVGLVIVFIGWHFMRAAYEILVESKDLQLVLRLFITRAFAMLIFAVPWVLFATKNFNGRRMALLMLFLGALLPLAGFANLVLHPDGLMLTSSGTKRYLIGTANIYMAAFFIIAIACYRARILSKFMSYAYMGWMLCGMALTQHRSVVVALGLIMIIDTLFCARASEKTARIAGIIVLSFAMAIIGPALLINSESVVGETITRISDTFDSENSTTKGRLVKWQARLELIKASWLFGTGFGRESTTERSRKTDRGAGHEAHNFVISVLTYEGVLGLIINLTLATIALRDAWKMLRRRSFPGSEVPFLFITFFLLYSLFNTTYFNALTSPAYFVAIGMVAYLKTIRRQPAKPPVFKTTAQIGALATQ